MMGSGVGVIIRLIPERTELMALAVFLMRPVVLPCNLLGVLMSMDLFALMNEKGVTIASGFLLSG